MIPKVYIPVVSLSVASVLAVLKLTIGIFAGSLSIISSAADSLLDVVSSTINYYALKKSEEPPDKLHPFGHGKFEALAAFVQSNVIFLTGIYILYQSYQKFISKKSVGNPDIGILIMIISLVATSILSFYLRYAAKREHSAILKADAIHYEIDILTNAAVLVALFIVKYTSFYLIDPIASAVISVYIIISAVRLSVEVSKDLLDVGFSDEMIKEIEKIIERESHYHIDYHKMRTRTSGKMRFLDLHLTLCKNLTLEEAHSIADNIEKTIIEEMKNIDVTIHIDPCEIKDCITKDACINDNLNLKLNELKINGSFQEDK